ncbi:Sugar hydrolase OS=Streptomyces microflavus OX=1919 GN=Smic_80040 PE=4 SV=1 [Streptomyces microflavus]
MFSAPTPSNQTPGGSVKNTGRLKAGGYNAVLNSLRNQPGGGPASSRPGPTEPSCAALSPGHGVGAGTLPAGILTHYVNRVWSRYSSSVLTVTPFAHEPNTKYFGRVSGNTMNFTNSAGAFVTSFQKPDSDSIFGCAAPRRPQRPGTWPHLLRCARASTAPPC